MRTFAFALPLLLAGCPMSSTAPEPQRYEGFFKQGFETESFQPCGSKEEWWVTEGAELRQRYNEVADLNYDPVYVVVRGQLGPEGKFGHLGLYTRQIAVSEVIEIRLPQHGDCE